MNNNKKTKAELIDELAELRKRVSDCEAVEENNKQVIGKKLRHAEKQYRDFYNSSPDMYVSIEPSEGKVIQCNKTLLDNLGYTKEEIIGQSVFNLYTSESAQYAKKNVFPNFQKTGEVHDEELQLKCKDGSIIDVSLNVAAVRDDQGNILHSMSSYRDITARKQMQRKLLVSGAFLSSVSSVMENLVEGLITINESGIIKTVNSATKTLFGYRTSEIIGKNVKMLMPEPFHSQHDQYIQNYISTGNAKIIGISREVVGLRKDNSTFPMDLSVNFVETSKGKIFIGLIRDITDRKKIEELKVAKEVAELANKAKSEFLSRMSHELRTPLNAIMGFSQVFKLYSQNLSDNQKNNIDTIYRSGDHLLQLINEILDLSRIESGKIIIYLEPVCIGQLLDELHGYAHSAAAENEIKIIDQTSDFHNQFILADKTRIKQVFINLISNGIKYNKKGGTLTYSIQKINHDRLRFHITDTGNGIAKDQLQSLFEPFNRLDVEGTNVEGTGIGLCIAKQLIELMNGTLEVESTLGKGSTFSVELPLTEPLKNLDEISKDHKSNYLNVSNDTVVNILYVEDNKDNMILVSEILSTLSNTNLITTHTAELGIDIAQSQQIHLILMDIKLPGMDGVKAMKILRKDDKTHNIPIIALSANAMKSDIDRALKAGFDSYIVKPIRVSRFLETVQKVIEEKVRIDS